MDILSQSNNPLNFNSNSFSNDNPNVEIHKETLLNDNKTDGHIYRLNPLLNESLNNLVKRFERTKIPKPPPTKGQSIRKKSKLSNSLPNIFLPPGFDDHKFSNNEKKVQWSNKLNLNLEKLKNVFCDTYNLWCERKQNQSIPNFERSSVDNIGTISSEICNNDLDSVNINEKHAIYDKTTNRRTLLERPTVINSNDKMNCEEKLSYSTHVYLDGAIIEPISPASPACSVGPIVSVEEKNNKAMDQESKLTISEIDSDKNVKPVGKKKGRPRKIQKVMKKTKETNLVEIEIQNIDENLQEKFTKSTLTKKQKKLTKTSDQDTQDCSVKASSAEMGEKSLTKKQIKMLKENSISSDKVEKSEKSTLRTKEKRLSDSRHTNTQGLAKYMEPRLSDKSVGILGNEKLILADDQNTEDADGESTLSTKLLAGNEKQALTKKQKKTPKPSKPLKKNIQAECNVKSKIVHDTKLSDNADEAKSTEIQQTKEQNVEDFTDANLESLDDKLKEFPVELCTKIDNSDEKTPSVEKSVMAKKTKKIPKPNKSNEEDAESSSLPCNIVDNMGNLFEKFNIIKYNEAQEVATLTAELNELSSTNKNSFAPSFTNDIAEDKCEKVNKTVSPKKPRKLPKQMKSCKESNSEANNTGNLSENIMDEKSEAAIIRIEVKELSEERNQDQNNLPCDVSITIENSSVNLESKKLIKNSEKLNKTKSPKNYELTPTKVNKSVPRKSRKIADAVTSPDRPTLSDMMNELKAEFEKNSKTKDNSIDINPTEHDSIPSESRKRAHRGNAKPNFNTELFEESEKKIVLESLKKTTKVKAGPKSKRQVLSQNDAVEEQINEYLSLGNTKMPKKGKGKPKSNEEYCDIEKKTDVMDKPFQNEDSEIMVDEIPTKKIIEIIDNEITKIDLPEIIVQSNDIEVLSKSITDSVDTSMLPPRKRYKRLMYLDDSKQQSSPKETEVIEDIQPIEICDILTPDHASEEHDLQSKKAANNRSKLKRKKSTKNAEDISVENLVIETPFLLSEENTPNSEDPHDKPNTSLKRSKREAAARGFANMVAMSLNSSSQAHETTSDTIKKFASNKSDIVDEISSDSSNSKVFKRPRKTSTAAVGNTKNKLKLSKSFLFMDEMEDDADETESQNSATKKQRLCTKDYPPSPAETIISNSTSSQESKYRKIRTNTFTDPKPTHWYKDVEKCGCKPSGLKHLSECRDKSKKTIISTKKNSKGLSSIEWNCLDNCLNRLTFTECNPKTCPCEDLCNNQTIRKMDWVMGLKVAEFQSKGRGVLTTKNIPDGTLIVEYVGDVINEVTFQDRMVNLYRDDAHHFCLHLDGELLIDAYRSGSIARFVNHSCKPNCEIQKWWVNGVYRICLFAIEDIELDTELTYDYNFCSFNTKITQICVCGSPNCRGFIGARLRPEHLETKKDRKKLFYAFGKMLSTREKLFVRRRAVFLVRGRVLGRCRCLGIRKTKQTHGMKLPSTISEIKRRKSKKNPFLTQMSTLNSIRSVRTRLLQNAQDNDTLTQSELVALILRDLYNSLLTQKDPLNPGQQIVAPFINGLKRYKYPEFYSMVGNEVVVCLDEVYLRLLDGKYSTMMAFDHDILQMIQTIELYAGKQSNIGKCAEQIKPIYKDLKMNAIALYEALTDELIDDRDKNKLLSNNLTQVSNAVNKSLMINFPDGEQSEVSSQSKTKKRKPGSASNVGSSRSRLERGAEVIKCVCGFLIEAGHVMVQCDQCFVWQHAYCMNVARSSELVDVTRMEPYFCHICLNIPPDSLVREIPRHFVITDETVDSGNTLFWTLLHHDLSLLKIDDFVYIPSDEGKDSIGSLEPMDSSRRKIMRIYSLWKDSSGNRWMEGGLFLRPYNEYLKSLSESRVDNSEKSNKRKKSSVMDLSTHKWHQQEVVYTDLTKILPLDVCVGRCHVLNNHTFRLGKPLIQDNNSYAIDDVFICDWLINKAGEWSEIDPTYLKINTKPYCFERYTDGANAESGEKFLRQLSAEDLLNIDREQMESSVVKTVTKPNVGLNKEEKQLLQTQLFNKLVTKLSEFAYEKTLKLSLSPPSSPGSQSLPSSRASSPLREHSCPISPSNPQENSFPHCARKQLFPKKTVTSSLPTIVNKLNTIASEYSEGSPKLMIVVDDELPSKEASIKVQEELSSVDDKSSELLNSSPKENFEDLSNPCSEIKYGDLLDLFKETGKCPTKFDKNVKMWNKKVSSSKGKKKIAVKKNVIKPVSEINSVDDNWVPTRNRLENNIPRRETRSRRTLPESEEGLGENKEMRIAKIVEEDDSVVDEEDEGRKTCFVKLERIRVNKTERKKQRKQDKDENVDGNTSVPQFSPSLSSPTNIENVSESRLPSNSFVETTTQPDPDSLNQPSSSSMASSNRSKRKKGVPKRIPFDFTYQNVGATKPLDPTIVALPFEYDVVDLSAGKTSHTDRPEETTTECQIIESPDLVASLLSKVPKPNLASVETRHITAANDFSSIENISSN